MAEQHTVHGPAKVEVTKVEVTHVGAQGPETSGPAQKDAPPDPPKMIPVGGGGSPGNEPTSFIPAPPAEGQQQK